jgi:hypothetical protein
MIAAVCFCMFERFQFNPPFVDHSDPDMNPVCKYYDCSVRILICPKSTLLLKRGRLCDNIYNINKLTKPFKFQHEQADFGKSFWEVKQNEKASFMETTATYCVVS